MAILLHISIFQNFLALNAQVYKVTGGCIVLVLGSGIIQIVDGVQLTSDSYPFFGSIVQNFAIGWMFGCTAGQSCSKHSYLDAIVERT